MHIVLNYSCVLMTSCRGWKYFQDNIHWSNPYWHLLVVKKGTSGSSEHIWCVPFRDGKLAEERAQVELLVDFARLFVLWFVLQEGCVPFSDENWTGKTAMLFLFYNVDFFWKHVHSQGPGGHTEICRHASLLGQDMARSRA